MEFLFRIYIVYIILRGINAKACSSDKDCLFAKGMICDLQNFQCIYPCSTDANCTQEINMTCNLQNFHCIYSCGSDADCPNVNNFTCSNVNECECPPNYFLYDNYCFYDCGVPPVFEVNGINFDYYIIFSVERYSLFYDCPSDDMPVSKIMICQEGGWTEMTSILSCLRDCQTVPVIANGLITLTQDGYTLYGTIANVSCSTGYNATVDVIQCHYSFGTWDNAACNLIDCSAAPKVANGNVALLGDGKTTYDAIAEITCETGYKSSVQTIQCRDTGVWDIATCDLIDCSTVPKVANGNVALLEDGKTTYDALAEIFCEAGYNSSVQTIQCRDTGVWENATCDLIDCGELGPLGNGEIDISAGTKYKATANFRCNAGYDIYGANTSTCLYNGSWSAPVPSCSIKGSISRTCGAGGVWNLSQYNCVRESIIKVNETVSTLSKNATGDEVDTVLEEILKVTTVNETTDNNSTLTDGELSVLSSLLETVGDVLATSSGIINENITDKFLEIASNLVDESNQESWQSLSQSENNDASARVLKAVDSLAEVLSNSTDDGPENNGTLIVKKNIAIEVKKVSNKDVLFPDPDKTVSEKDDANADWFKQARSSLRLETAALKNKSVQYATTAVMYRDLSKILPNKRSNTNNKADDTDYIINAPILSLTISPQLDKLNPPLQLNFTHDMTNFSNPLCSYWAFPNGNIGQGFWSSERCFVKTTNTNYTICLCDHLTNFAVLMSPFLVADAASKALRIISMTGIGISIACLTVTLIVYIFFWKYLQNDRTTALINLCVALLLSYILFLAGVDRTESSVACAVIAAVLQYIYLVVFCIMLVEGIGIAITVLYVFKTKSRIRIMLIFAWVIPAIIVGISLGATQAEGYGNDNFCWLSVENGLIWSFIGPALFIITFNGICLIIVIRIMFKTKAMETKTVSEKIKTSVWSLCVLLPIMGVSWILGIFYVNDTLNFIQYVFAILNGLQGFFILLFHCLLNEQVKKAIQLRNRRRSSS
ncbi:adhesion G protein-coupled receptor L4-like [Ruditapes philippinarum]|uniref:adhesion G protein-coupled receptor L4-like n=1 Tax=Ruditapes philippinarum TaxID=129788 RepID=UPI00295AA5D7|nr:adhesion G protein-coupled receptor L4-like [Ruditapes philippinarum]